MGDGLILGERGRSGGGWGQGSGLGEGQPEKIRERRGHTGDSRAGDRSKRQREEEEYESWRSWSEGRTVGGPR